MKQVKCIMLVDDNEIDNLLAQRIIELNEISQSIILARNGIDALRKINEYFSAYTRLPDLIIVDLHMPLMNGFELIEKIKSLPSYSESKTAIVLITASLDDEKDKDILKSLSILGYMQKPFDKEELLKLIEKISYLK